MVHREDPVGLQIAQHPAKVQILITVIAGVGRPVSGLYLLVAAHQPQRATLAEQCAQTIFGCLAGCSRSHRQRPRKRRRPRPAATACGILKTRSDVMPNSTSCVVQPPTYGDVYTRSNTAAMPCPPPMHIVANA